jgi:hypothetical protein
VCGPSLHLGYVAAAHGVPVYRPRPRAGEKFTGLARFRGIHDIAAPAIRFGRRPTGTEVTAAECEVTAHWDRIASMAGRGEPSAGREQIERLAAELPRSLEPRSVSIQPWRVPHFPPWMHRTRAALRRLRER